MRTAHRFNGPGQPYEGLTVLRPKTHRRPGVDWSGVVRLVPEMLDVPLRRKKPTTYFVNSMSDLFHEGLSATVIAAVFGVMAACPQHTFQVLTKRAKRMRGWFADAMDGSPLHRCAVAADDALEASMTRRERAMLFASGRGSRVWPLPNVHLGVSAENQETADERIPHLLATPAAVRFVSAEPLLEPLDLRPWLRYRCGPCERFGVEDVTRCNPRIDLVIAGGESGPGARPCDVEWIRDIVRQCKRAGTACFVKQLGAHFVDAKNGVGGVQANPDRQVVPAIQKLKHPKGGDPAEWSEDLRVREMPERWERERDLSSMQRL